MRPRIALLIVPLILAMSTSAFAASVKLINLVLYQPEAVLRERLGNAGPLSEYTKRVIAICEHSLNSDRPESLDIVIVLKPGGKTRAWFSSTLEDMPDRSELKEAIEAIPASFVQNGPVAFALCYDLNGAERVMPGDGQFKPPIPEEWKAKAKGIEEPLTVPDGFIPLVWPDEGKLSSTGDEEPGIYVPDGYELQKLDVTEGHIAKPKGWFYNWFSHGQSIVWTISKENSQSGSYDTGMRIQFFYSLSKVVKDKKPQAVAEGVISKKKQTSKEVFRECSPAPQGDFTRVCLETLETIEGASGRMDYHILYSILWSDKRDSLVIMTFGTPAEDWEKNKSIADVMAHVVLVGEDFWKNKNT